MNFERDTTQWNTPACLSPTSWVDASWGSRSPCLRSALRHYCMCHRRLHQRWHSVLPPLLLVKVTGKCDESQLPLRTHSPGELSALQAPSAAPSPATFLASLLPPQGLGFRMACPFPGVGSHLQGQSRGSGIPDPRCCQGEGRAGPSAAHPWREEVCARAGTKPALVTPFRL